MLWKGDFVHLINSRCPAHVQESSKQCTTSLWISATHPVWKFCNPDIWFLHIVSGAPSRAPSHHFDKYSLHYCPRQKYDQAKNDKAVNFTFSLKDNRIDIKHFNLGGLTNMTSYSHILVATSRYGFLSMSHNERWSPLSSVSGLSTMHTLLSFTFSELAALIFTEQQCC